MDNDKTKDLKGIKGILFDYGGTLDTGGCHWGQMLWYAYRRQQVPVTEKMFRDGYVYGERSLGNLPIIKPDYTFHRTLDTKIRLEMDYLCTHGWDADENEIHRMHDAVLEDLYTDVRAETRRSGEVLEKLYGKYSMGLVSNFYGNIRTVLREFCLDGYFKTVVESTEVGIRKPDPKIWTTGVERIGLRPEEVLVVGDSYYKDVIPAMKAGCRAAWLKGEGWTKKTYDETVPDMVITDLSQLVL